MQAHLAKVLGCHNSVRVKERRIRRSQYTLSAKKFSVVDEKSRLTFTGCRSEANCASSHILAFSTRAELDLILVDNLPGGVWTLEGGLCSHPHSSGG